MRLLIARKNAYFEIEPNWLVGFQVQKWSRGSGQKQCYRTFFGTLGVFQGLWHELGNGFELDN